MKKQEFSDISLVQVILIVWDHIQIRLLSKAKFG